MTTFDVIHDTPYPQELIAQIYAALKADGQWLCEDIKGFESFEENESITTAFLSGLYE